MKGQIDCKPHENPRDVKKGLTHEFIEGKDGRNQSNVEQQKQPSNRESNHLMILTNTKAALWA